MTDNEKHTEQEASHQCPESDATAAKPAKWPGRKGIYLLPNLFTTGALFSGFYAVVASMNGDFENAAIAIFISMILDGFDGRVARMTNTQSDFGAEYDSLADMVSFGVAPALVAFSWALQDLGKIGWVAAFVYVAGAALRLARFNTQLAVADKNFFTGLASPAAAAIVAGTVWAFSESGTPGSDISWLMALIVPGAGLLMVSNFRYHSFKGLDLKGKVPFVALLAVVLVFVVVSIDPAKVLLGAFMAYALSGPGFEGWQFIKARRKK
ncbi:CDP-diacylglycerol--serine O-phosphatidyltransferase [Bacterioplanes sanyensis]|uniref:CDP-diacylglycerol--serine O-phosphatidyltransferase n=1 Tax=Bacterioplanes sanyensis TaxID=1249553 RepID=A0A222FRK8_9GAMM|nr:CDP-diacylglycerol--serine O-phosphatidyltransferase [Bacterioplanes sanyensis]ASP40853.1 CDP-diacylglycerol--serine O-phosphatidyltransferase [Bacterioplanes sanyensis]